MLGIVRGSLTPVAIDRVVAVEHLEETATNVGRLHVGEVVDLVGCAAEYFGHLMGVVAGEECRAADNFES